MDFKEIIKESSLALLIRVIGVASSYLFIFIIARYYGAESLGLFALAQTFLMLITILSRSGLDTASVKFISSNSIKNNISELRNTYFVIIKFVFVTSIVLSMILYMLKPIFVQLMNNQSLNPILNIVAIIIFPFSILLINSESFRGLKKIINYSIYRKMTLPLFSSLFILLLYYLGFNSPLSPIYSYMLSVIILSIISSINWMCVMPKSISDKTSRVNIYKLLKISTPMLVTSSMSYLLNWLCIIFLGIYSNEYNVGIFNLAMKVSFVTSISLFAINSIAAPKFSEYYTQDDINGLKNAIRNTSKLIFITSLPFLLIFLFFPDIILNIFGEEYMNGRKCLILLTIGQFINSISGSTGYILQMTGNQKVFQNIMFFSVLINIALNIILIPKYSINGAAFATMATMILWNLLSMIYIKKKLGILSLYIPYIKR